MCGTTDRIMRRASGGKPTVVDDDAEAYRLVSESMGELTIALNRGQRVHAESGHRDD